MANQYYGTVNHYGPVAQSGNAIQSSWNDQLFDSVEPLDHDPTLCPPDPENPADYFHDSSSESSWGSEIRLDEDHKWILRTATCVEDVLLKHAEGRTAKDSMVTALASAYVLDTSNKEMRGWFTRREWEEILQQVPALPPVDTVLVDSLVRFDRVRTVERLREVISTTSFLPPDTNYDRAIHFNAEWAEMVIRSVLILLETDTNPLSAKTHAEDWFSMQIWAPIIDKCFIGIPGMEVQRKEIACIATARRRNRDRSSEDRAATGPRLDGIVHTAEDDTYEYGAMEVGKKWNGVNSTKSQGDGAKLIKCLRDMLRRLHERVDNRADVIHKLQVVGLLTQGLRCQLLRICHPKGYICLLVREKTLAVPTVASELDDLLDLVVQIARAKEIIHQCHQSVRARPETGVWDRVGRADGKGPELPWTPHTPPS